MECSPPDDPDRPSPYDSAWIAGPDGSAKICYSRPSTRGREIFGALVPYDTLWRTGANEPTIIHLDRPATIAGMHVEPGDYSIYTVPNPDQWTVVVNASTSQWGITIDAVGALGNEFRNAYTEDVRAQEVGRAPIDVVDSDFTELLTIELEQVTGLEWAIVVLWAETEIRIPLVFDPLPETG